MKKIALLLFVITFISCNSTKINSQTKALNTEKYAGVYSYGDDIEKGAIGIITLFAETDNTILFHISLNLGPKSYNSGATYGHLTLIDGKGVFSSSNNEYQNKGCKWEISINTDTLTISTIEGECGFGHSVMADGVYTKKDNHKPDFFEDRLGEKTYFSKTSPEEYYKESN